MDKNILKNTIKKANIQYRIGEPIKIKELPKEVQDILEQKEGELTDKSYDFLLVTLYGIVPNDEIFDDGIIESWDEEEVDKIYNELRDKYTDKEIADAFIFPGNMTKDEQESLKISMSEHKRKISKKIKPKKKKIVKPVVVEPIVEEPVSYGTSGGGGINDIGIDGTSGYSEDYPEPNEKLKEAAESYKEKTKKESTWKKVMKWLK